MEYRGRSVHGYRIEGADHNANNDMSTPKPPLSSKKHRTDVVAMTKNSRVS